MSILSSLKGKVAGTIMVGALVTGAGAAAASGFSDHIDTAAKEVGNKAAALAAFLVNQNAEVKEDAVEKKVQDEFARVGTEAAVHFGSEVSRGNNAVNTYATGYQTDITNTANAYRDYAKGQITGAVNTEILEATNEIDAAAKAKASALIASANAIIPVWTQPAE
jgi:hypothetical protein